MKTFAAIIYIGSGIYLHLKIKMKTGFLKNALLMAEFEALHQAAVAAHFE